MRTVARPYVPILLALAFSTNAFAEDATKTTGWGGGAEFNANISKGNTDIETLGAAAHVDYRAEMLNTTLKADYMRNRTDEIERARRIGASLRTGYNLTNNLDFFALGAWMQDRFRGIDSQWLVTPGLSIYAVNTESLTVRFEGGIGWLTETFYPATWDSSSFAAGTAGLGFRLKISDVADFTDDATWITHLSGGGDWRLQNTAAIDSRMTEMLSLKFSQTTLYRHVPVVAHKKIDNYTTAAIVLKF